jgi:hypothetical protein
VDMNNPVSGYLPPDMREMLRAHYEASEAAFVPPAAEGTPPNQATNQSETEEGK